QGSEGEAYVTTAIRFMFPVGCNYTYNMLMYLAVTFFGYKYTALFDFFIELQESALELFLLREMGRSFLHKLVHWRIDLSAFSNAFVVFFANCLDRYGNVFYGQILILFVLTRVDFLIFGWIFNIYDVWLILQMILESEAGLNLMSKRDGISFYILIIVVSK
ncbi:hypothetical protein ACJX0J_034939, partial [Zea mays]